MCVHGTPHAAMRVWSCYHVVLLSCLYVVIDYPAALSAVSRVVSVDRSLLLTHSKSSIIQQAKKNLIKRQGSFHKPNQVCPLVRLQGIESLEQCLIALPLYLEQSKYQYHVQAAWFYNDKM